jgi:hypothetical protein
LDLPKLGTPKATGLPDRFSKNTPLLGRRHLDDLANLDEQWKLGRMYADGNGVKRDDLRAFNYFTQIAATHPDEPRGTEQAGIVANAFVALGHYYLTGISRSRARSLSRRRRNDDSQKRLNNGPNVLINSLCPLAG